MKLIELLVLVCVVFVSKKAASSKPRSINVALETVFEFEKSSDIDLINKVQVFLNKIKDLIEEEPDRDEPVRRSERYKFTDFLEDLVNTLQSFGDKDLEAVIEILDGEIRSRRNHDDAVQGNVRLFLSEHLGRLKSATKIRNKLNNLSRTLQNDKQNRHSHFLGFINSLYKKDSEEKLAKFIRKLKIFRRNSFSKSKYLHQTIRNAVQLIIFEHVSSLSKAAKRRAKKLIQDYLGEDRAERQHKGIYSRGKPHIEINSNIFLEKRESTEVVTKNNLFYSPGTNTAVNKKTNRDRSKTRYKINNNVNNLKFKKKEKKKLTHITLYPENLNIPQENIKAQIKSTRSMLLNANGDMRKVNEKKLNDGMLLSSLSHSAEIEVNFKSEDSSEGSDSKNVRVYSQSPSSIIKAPKTKQSTYYKHKAKKLRSSTSTTLAYFGNLYKSKTYVAFQKERSKNILNQLTNEKYLDNKIGDEDHRILKENSVDITDNSKNIIRTKQLSKEYTSGEIVKTTEPIFYINDSSREIVYRRANDVKIEEKISTLPKDNIVKRNTYHLPNITFTTKRLVAKTISNTKKIITKLKQNNTKNDDQNEINSGLNNFIANTTIKFVTSITTNKTENDNILKNTTMNTRKVSTRAIDSTNQISSFDLQEYLKKSEIKDIQDVAKKTEIERKMKEDLENLLLPPTTNATTTEAFTDIFDALDDAFDLSPVK